MIKKYRKNGLGQFDLKVIIWGSHGHDGIVV